MTPPSRTALAAMLGDVIVQAVRDGVLTRPHLESARARLAAVVTIVVTGRRSAGKTSVVNKLLSEPVAVVGYSAEDEPARLFASKAGSSPAWMATTLLPPSLMRGRRIVEVPEHLTADAAARAGCMSQLDPDVLVHVSRHAPRRDELDWIDHAQGQWSLGPLETVWVGPLPGPPTTIGTSWQDLRPRADAVERLVEARRCHEVMQQLAALAGRSDDPTWRDRVVDDLERLSLSPEGHVLRERWALETCVVRRQDVPPALRDQVTRLVLDPGTSTGHERQALLALAAHWRAQVSVLPPLAAEVARVVARTLHIEAVATRGATAPEEGVAS